MQQYAVDSLQDAAVHEQGNFSRKLGFLASRAGFSEEKIRRVLTILRTKMLQRWQRASAASKHALALGVRSTSWAARLV
jgi:hypothetical protein